MAPAETKLSWLTLPAVRRSLRPTRARVEGRVCGSAEEVRGPQRSGPVAHGDDHGTDRRGHAFNSENIAKRHWEVVHPDGPRQAEDRFRGEAVGR